MKLLLCYLLAMSNLALASLTPPSALVFPPIASRDRSYFRGLVPEIGESAYRDKWAHALKQPLHLFTSFPESFYDDLKQVPALGPVGPCYGDAHFGNFGFVRFAEGARFVYDDFDDSGIAPVVSDALRLLVSLRLARFPESTIESLAEQYEAVVSGKREPKAPIPGPNLSELRAKLVKENAHHGHFRGDSEVEPISQREKSAIAAAVASLPFKVEDVGRYVHPHGGSAGLERYWLLVVDSSGAEDIIEIKRETAPSTARGGWGLPPEPRIEWAASQFWKGLTHSYYRSIPVAGVDFLVRSRAKKEIAWEKLSTDETERYLHEEMRLIASQHRASWAAHRSDAETVGAWLVSGSAIYAKRVEAIFARLSK